MSAYVIAQIEVFDPETYKNYLAGFMPVFERHGGRIVGRSPEAEVVEGEWVYPRTVILRFPTVEDAHRWHDDPDYRALADFRHRSAKTNLVIVEGVD